MSGVNKVILVGHLGKDPEIKRNAAGAAVGMMSLATSESWRDKATGERKEKTEWHRVVLFAEHAVKFAEQYLKKGAKVYVEGKLQTRKWTDQAGHDRYTTEIVVSGFHSSLQSLDRAPGQPTPSESDYGTTKQDAAAGEAKPKTTAAQDMDDEIPF